MARALQRRRWMSASVPAVGSVEVRPALFWRLWPLLIALLAMVWGGYRLYQATGRPVTIVVDGAPIAARAHRATVAGVLMEAGIPFRPGDLVRPGLRERLPPDGVITVARARPVWIEADGERRLVYSRARTLAQLFAEAGVFISPYDEVLVDGRPVAALDAPFPEGGRLPVGDERGDPGRVRGSDPPLVTIRRAVPIWVHDGAASYRIDTTAETIGEALWRERVTLYLGDLVRPGLGERVSAGLHVYIARSVPFIVRVDGREIRTRTRQRTVADALAELGIVVAGADIVTPTLETALRPGMVVSITRVREAIEIEQEPVPYRTVWVPDDELEIDRRRIDEPGREGLIKRRFRVVYHDGRPVSRVLEDEWVAQQPITRVVAYGRKIVLRTLETPYGPITYWRKIRMLATSYSPSTAGVAPDDPYFGRTRLGWVMRKGIVAVDPTVIKLGSRVYVPGYGIGDAADTGGLIRGRRIDLGYDDDNLVLWYRWVGVYLLASPPPGYQIRWILPDWPRERRR